MRKFLVLSLVAVLAIGTLVYAHTTGERKSIELVDGTTTKGRVVYYGDNAGGSQFLGFWNIAADYMASGSQNNTDYLVYTNNIARYRLTGPGVHYFYNGSSQVPRTVLNLDKSLTDNTSTSLFSLTLASNTSAAVRIVYGVEASEGTDMQVYTGVVVCRGTNKAAAFTVSCTNTPDGSGTYATAGTLTVTWAITGANPAVVSVTVDSSLTSPTDKIHYDLTNLGLQTVAVN